MAGYLCPTNWVDAAGVTFSTLAGTTMSRALTGVQQPWGQGLARGAKSGTADIEFECDLGALRPIHVLGVAGFNGANVTVTFALYESAGATDQVLAPTTVQYAASWGMPFGSAAWLLAPSGTVWEARYIRVRIQIATGATYVDLRRLWAGVGAQIAEGWDMRFKIESVSGGSSERDNRAGVVFASTGQRWRRIRATLTNRERAAIVGDGADDFDYGAWGALAVAGNDTEIVVALAGNSSNDRQRWLQTIIAQQTGDNSVLEWGDGDVLSVPETTFEEAPYPALS